VRRTAFISVLSVLVVAGCGGGGKDKSTASSAAAPAATATATAPAAGPAQLQTKPKVTVPSGKPPTKLVIKDIVKGTGATAQTGDTVSRPLRRGVLPQQEAVRRRHGTVTSRSRSSSAAAWSFPAGTRASPG